MKENNTKTPQVAIRASTSAIAVIGISCHYLGASEIRQLWENILAKRRQFWQMPDRRLPVLLDYVYSIL